MDACEQLGIAWPPPVPVSLRGNPWLAVTTEREKEVVAIALEMNEKTIWVDSSQTVARARNSLNECCPCVLPGCHLFHFPSRRFLCGRDLMRLQGYPVETLPGAFSNSDVQLADLAGNSFSSTVSVAVDMAVLLNLDCPVEDDCAHEVCQHIELLTGSHDDSFEL